MSRVVTIRSKTVTQNQHKYPSRSYEVEFQQNFANDRTLSSIDNGLYKGGLFQSTRRKQKTRWVNWMFTFLCILIGMVNLSICINIHQHYYDYLPTHTDLSPEDTNIVEIKSESHTENEPIEYYQLDNLELAWRGEIERDALVRGFGKIYLVVSHCDKDLSWLDQFTRGRIKGKNKTIESITVFSKCGNKVTGVPRYAKVVNMPNVGRCDHTYAHWMAQYGTDENFKDNDVIFFVKDNPYQTRQGHWRMFNDMLRQTVTNGFSCALRPNYMIQFRELDPSIFHLWDLVKTFNYKTEYQRQGGQSLSSASNGSWGIDLKVNENNNGETQEGEFISQYLNLESWQDAMGINAPKPFMPVCYGGVFSTTIKQIRKGSGLWPRIEKSLSRTDNLEEGHFAERSWAAMLMKPLSNEGIQAIDSRLDDAACRNFYELKLRQYFADRCGTLIHNRTLHIDHQLKR